MSEAKQNVQEGLDALAVRLDPIIATRLADHLGGLPWTVILQELDRAKGFTSKTYRATDLQAQLRMLTERLGAFKYPFDDGARTASVLGGELRIVRNRWAHGSEFDWLDAWRANDFAVRLLTYFDDDEGRHLLEEIRQQAFPHVVDEFNVSPESIPLGEVPGDDGSTPGVDDGAQEETGGHGVNDEPEDEDVQPEREVLIRTGDDSTPTIGAERSEFEPWPVVIAGDPTVFDHLRTKASRTRVRSVVVEITDFEGPIEIGRLARLVGLAFGVRRLHAKKLKQIVHQIEATGLIVDDDKFVWPNHIDRENWTEFRPSGSEIDRPFFEISPIEIYNASEFIEREHGQMTPDEEDAKVLRTFGRKRRTKQIDDHLRKAYRREA